MFNGVFSVEVWNESKTKASLFYKTINIPFQPAKDMEIFVDNMAFNVNHISWSADSGNFTVVCAEVESWHGDTYLDLAYFKKQFEKKNWEYGGQSQREWPWGEV